MFVCTRQLLLAGTQQLIIWPHIHLSRETHTSLFTGQEVQGCNCLSSQTTTDMLLSMNREGETRIQWAGTRTVPKSRSHDRHRPG